MIEYWGVALWEVKNNDMPQVHTKIPFPRLLFSSQWPNVHFYFIVHVYQFGAFSPCPHSFDVHVYLLVKST